MKLRYAFFVCAWTALSTMFVIFNPTLVSAENKSDYVSAQPEISALVSLAVAPYKWEKE